MIDWEREMFYLMIHSTHVIYGYMVSNIWLKTILKETRHIGYSYRLKARVLLYAPSNTQDNTYAGFSYTSHGALAGTRNISMGTPSEGSIRRPTTPWANALPLSYVPLPHWLRVTLHVCCSVDWVKPRPDRRQMNQTACCPSTGILGPSPSRILGRRQSRVHFCPIRLQVSVSAHRPQDRISTLNKSGLLLTSRGFKFTKIGFLLLRRGLNLNNNKFNLISCRFNLNNNKFNLISCRFKLINSRFNLISCRFKLNNNKFNLISGRFKLNNNKFNLANNRLYFQIKTTTADLFEIACCRQTLREWPDIGHCSLTAVSTGHRICLHLQMDVMGLISQVVKWVRGTCRMLQHIGGHTSMMKE